MLCEASPRAEVKKRIYVPSLSQNAVVMAFHFYYGKAVPDADFFDAGFTADVKNLLSQRLSPERRQPLRLESVPILDSLLRLLRKIRVGNIIIVGNHFFLVTVPHRFKLAAAGKN